MPEQLDPRKVLAAMIEELNERIKANRERFDNAYNQQAVAYDIGQDLAKLESLEKFQKLMGWV